MATWQVKVAGITDKVLSITPDVYRIDLGRGEETDHTFSIEYVFNDQRQKLYDPPFVSIVGGRNFNRDHSRIVRNGDDRYEVAFTLPDIKGYGQSFAIEVKQQCQVLVVTKHKVAIGEIVDRYDPSPYSVIGSLPQRGIVHVPPLEKLHFDLVVGPLYYGGDSDKKVELKSFQPVDKDDPHRPTYAVKYMSGNSVVRVLTENLAEEKNYSAIVEVGGTPFVFIVSTKPKVS